jgi:hypothetical protein
MAVYKSPGVYTRDVDYWIPANKGYSTLLRKYKINNIFNLDREVFSDTFTLVNRRSSYKQTFKIPVGDKVNKPNLFNTLKKYISTIKI